MRFLAWSLALATALVLWFVLRQEADPTTAPSLAPTPVAASALDRSAMSAPPNPSRELAAENRDPAGARTVRVVATLPDGRSAAAAEVRCGTREARPDRWNWGRKPPADREAHLRATGQDAVADDRGCASIHVASTAVLCVRSGEHYGEAEIDDDTREVHVALDRDVTLCVQVVDGDDRPRANVRVEVRVTSQSRRDGDRDDDWNLPRTDALGMALLPHLQLATTLPGPEVVAWHMSLRCDLHDAVERTITADQLLEGKPLLLRVAAGGAIAVDAVDPDGKWLRSHVALVDPITETTRDQDRDDGASWFRQLPLGRTWTVVVSSFGQEVRRVVTGPARVDEVVRTRVDLPLRNISLRGRVVRPDGAPVPQAKIRLSAPPARFWRDTEDSRDGSLGDRIGDFDFGGVAPADVDAVAGATLTIEREPYCARSTIALAPLHPGENDLGDVVVAVAPDEVLLASVEVRAGDRNLSSSAHALLSGRGDRGVNTVDSFAAAHVDRITFHGPPTSCPLEIGCSCPGFLGKSVPVSLGQHVVVELEPAASLAVHLLLPPVPRRLWTAQLTDDAGTYGSYYDSGDGFEWRDEAPGCYRLLILVDGRPVHEVAALDLVVGRNRWPRGDGAIDLRGTAAAFRVAIEAADGGDVEWPHGSVVPSSSVAPSENLDEGRRKCPLPWFVPRSEPEDLILTAAGFVPVRVPGPTTDTVVRLQRCTALHVHTAQGSDVLTIVRVLEDPVRDPWVRALDGLNLHEQYTTDAMKEPVELTCVPGTVVEIAVERDGKAGAPQRITIGRERVEVTAR